jgi:hypothetical protein
MVSAPRWSHTGAPVEGCNDSNIAAARCQAADLPVSVLADILVSHPGGAKLLTSKQGSPALRQWVLEHFPEAYERADQLRYSHKWELAKTVLGADWCTHDLLARAMVGDLVKQHRHTVLERRACPPDLLHHILEMQSSWDRVRAARQKCVGLKELEQLSRHSDFAVRQGVAYSPKASVEMLERLADDEHPEVRKAVLSQGQRLSQDTLVRLSADEAAHISRLAMRFVDVRSADFRRAATEGMARTRSAAAKRPDCPVDLLEHLAKDSNASVRASVASNPACPHAVMRALVHDQSVQVRDELAHNQFAPAEVYRQLVHDADRRIRFRLAVNPACDGQAVVVLAGDEHAGIRKRALAHPNLPEEYRALHQVTA